MKSLKVKLKLNYIQQLKLNTLSNEHRLLYNHLLHYVKESKNSDFRLINAEYVKYRNENNLTINSKSAQNTSRTFINNIKSFFTLHKKDKTARFPHNFKSWKYFNTFMLDFNNANGGFKFSDSNLILNLNNTKNKLIIELPAIVNKTINYDKIKTITFKKQNNNYFLIITYDNNPLKYEVDSDNFISLDLGITSLYTLVSDTINSEAMINQKFETLENRIKFVQSKLDIKKKFSIKWKRLHKRFLRLKHKLANKNKDHQHKVSTYLINKCINNKIGTIICGDIKVKKIIKNENKGLKSASKNFGLARFKTFLQYKSKSAGIDFKLVNEAYTSQTNSFTNKREFKNISLADREVTLINNIKIDRDLNSAINISKKIMGEWLTQIEDFENIISNFHKIYIDSYSNEHGLLYDNTL